jgi:hypothetical protein
MYELYRVEQGGCRETPVTKTGFPLMKKDIPFIFDFDLQS